MKANDDDNGNDMDVDSGEPESSGSDLDMNPLPTLRSSNSVLLKVVFLILPLLSLIFLFYSFPLVFH